MLLIIAVILAAEFDGYIEAARKLNSVLQPKGIEGVHLTGAGHSPDLCILIFGCLVEIS